MISFAIDYFLILCYALLIYLLLAKLGLFKFDDPWLIAGVYGLLCLPAFFYSFLTEAFFNGQTIGKKITKIKVIKIDGTRATLYQYFIRWICTILDIFLCMGAIGIGSIIITKRAQRIGDIAADTSVISVKQNTMIHETLFAEITAAYTVTFPQVMRLSDKDLNTIKEVFNKGYERKDYNIVLALSNKLVELLDVKPQMGPEEFIEIIIKDYYYTFKNR